MEDCSTKLTENSSFNLHKKENGICELKQSESVTTCSVCKSSFTKREDFREHIETVGCGGNEQLSCDVCNKTFSTSSCLKTLEIQRGSQKKIVCDTCRTDSTSKSSLTYLPRKESNFKDKRLKGICSICSVCKCPFIKRVDFRDHIQRVGCGGSERYPCDVCDKTFSHPRYLRSHRGIHNDTQEQYFCDICNAKFLWKHSLIRHLALKLHDEPKRLKTICSSCKASFTRRRDFRLHLERVGCRGEERYPCNVCDKVFPLSASLKKHSEIHDVARQKYFCDTCCAEFDWKGSLISHLQKKLCFKRQTSKDLSRICSICKCSFTKRADLREHLKAVGCGGRERFPCDICDVSFAKSPNLKTHLKIHIGKGSKYICNTCPADFTQKTALIEHLKKGSLCRQIYLKDIRSLCTVCETSFAGRKDFKEHFETVGCGGKERFPCNICGKSYYKSGYLWEHQKQMHGNTRQKNTCNTCGAEFVWKSGFYDHRAKRACQPKLLNSVVKYTCNLCNSSFDNWPDLKSHIETVGCGRESVRSQSPLSEIASPIVPSSSQIQREVSPVTAHEEIFRVYVFKNTSSIDFPTFVSSKMNDIKKTLNTELKYHCNEMVKPASLPGDVECIEIVGKSENEVLATLGTHRSQFIPILNTLDIDNSVADVLKEAVCSIKEEIV